MKTSKEVRIQLNIQKIIFIVLLLSATGLLAWLSHKHTVQFDWTRNNRNSLSQQSVELLQTFKEPVSVRVYVQDDPTLHNAVEEILNRYKRVYDRFEYRLINPDIDIVSAQQDKVTQYGQVIISYQGRSETINNLSEQAISSALLRLGRSQQKQLIFISGHGERSPDDGNNFGYSKLAAELADNGIESTTVNLLQSGLADNTAMLVIAGPSGDYLEGELEHILNYIENGGNLLWLMDPGKTHGLDKVAERLGITFLDGIIVDNNINLRRTLRIEHPAIIPVLEYYPHAITNTIQYNTLFSLARGLSHDAESGWQASTLFTSLQQSWSETAGLSEEIVFQSEQGDIAGPITLGLALERPVNGEDEQPEKASQRVVVIGDSDFLANNYIGAGANLSLGLNIINWLAGDDDLIAVEPKNAPDLKLELSDTATLLIGLGFFIFLPVSLLAAGFIIWFNRRKL